MIKQGRGSGAVLTFILWYTVATAEPLTPVAEEQEFLEFLGGWELEDGTWVNPLEFLGADNAEITDEPRKQPLSNTQSYEHDHNKPIPTQAPKTTTPP